MLAPATLCPSMALVLPRAYVGFARATPLMPPTAAFYPQRHLESIRHGRGHRFRPTRLDWASRAGKLLNANNTWLIGSGLSHSTTHCLGIRVGAGKEAANILLHHGEHHVHAGWGGALLEAAHREATTLRRAWHGAWLLAHDWAHVP
jgi:hypothetical protein